MSEFQDLASLIVGERINHPYVLAMEWLKFSDVLIQPEGSQSEQEVREAVLNFESSIPDVLKTEQYVEERKKAVVFSPTDVREECCGFKVGQPLCPHLDMERCRDEEDWICEQFDDCEMKIPNIDPYRLKRAIVNLLQELGYLSKRMYTEKIIPEPQDYKELETVELDQNEFEVLPEK